MSCRPTSYDHRKQDITDWSSFDLTLDMFACAEPSRQLAMLTVLVEQQNQSVTDREQYCKASVYTYGANRIIFTIIIIK